MSQDNLPLISLSVPGDRTACAQSRRQLIATWRGQLLRACAWTGVDLPQMETRDL